jgi:hypothetical protein
MLSDLDNLYMRLYGCLNPTASCCTEQTQMSYPHDMAHHCESLCWMEQSYLLYFMRYSIDYHPSP